jgi:hypothetical protein
VRIEVSPFTFSDVVTKSSRRRVLTAAVYWLPVVAVVAALFAVPSSNGESRAVVGLRVSPGANTYGGQKLTFSGDMGRGIQRIRLERRDRLGSPWGTVTDPRTGKPFVRRTKANGTFSFDFPAPAMNGTYFRVASGKAVTRAHQFATVHQDADVHLVEVYPSDVPLPRGFAVANESFRIAVDTADHDRFGNPTKPILVGRTVDLQVRVGDGWNHVATATVRKDGWLNFGTDVRPTVTGSKPEVYRAVMQSWTEDGDRIGWMPSVPFYLNVVLRPDPVRNLDSNETPSSVKLTWGLPTDPDRARIVIARTAGAGAPQPSAGTPHQVLDTIPGGETSYTDGTVNSGWTYKYAVYTVSRDGVYTAVPGRLTVVTPDAKQRGEG